jgi:hypothetical protein
MKTFLIILLSIGILLQFYFGDKEITKWRTLAKENHIEHYDCIGDKVDLAKDRDSYRDSLNATVIASVEMAHKVWKNGYLLAWTHRYDKTDFDTQMKKDSIWFRKNVLE